MEEKKKKKRNFFSLIGEVILWVLALFCISTSICNIIDSHTNYGCSYFGYRTSVIVSESMAYRNPENTYLDDSLSQIAKYDVITAKVVSYEEIEIYDVVLHVEEAGLICHRVVDKYESDGVQYLVTRGDSNNLDDAPFAYSSFRGKVINVIPKIGEFVLFMQSVYFLLGIFLAVFVVSFLCFLFSFLDKRGEKGLTEDESAKDGPIDTNDLASASRIDDGGSISLIEQPSCSATSKKQYCVLSYRKRSVRRLCISKARCQTTHKRYSVTKSSKQKKGVYLR